jgi:hypothetical protein
MKALKLRSPFKRAKDPDTSSQLSSQFSGIHPRSDETREQISEGPKARVDSIIYAIDREPTNCSLQSDGPDFTASHESSAIDIIGEKDSYGIKVLYSPPSAVLDIVFVHGLTGSAYSTWLHKGSGKHWPRDLIKNDIEDARVMTFGYDADVARFWGQAAQDGISGYANDLLGKLARKRKSVVRKSSLLSRIVRRLSHHRQLQRCTRPPTHLSDMNCRKGVRSFLLRTVSAGWSHNERSLFHETPAFSTFKLSKLLP